MEVAAMWKSFRITLLLFFLSALSACSWHRVDTPPAYMAEEIPIVIGMVSADNLTSKWLAPDLVKELETIGEFERIVYPYRSGEPVDCLFQFDATVTFRAEGWKTVGAGIVGGLTFGLSGMVIGPSAILIHDVDFFLTNGRMQVAHDKIHAESKAEWGVFADTVEVVTKQRALQLRRISSAISEKLQVHRKAILETCTGYKL